MKFEKIKGRLGFGCMRLPMKDEEIDKAEFCKMIDEYMSAGFNYFDTAYGYIDGKSEKAIKECLTSRYDREDYVLADKLSYWTFETDKDVLPLFEKQLNNCGVDYFDFYLFHCINKEGYEKHQKYNTFDIIKKLKEKGKIKHLGMSFHDSAEFLDKVLTEQPYLEFVQLQINYLDYDDPTVQSKACYDVAVKHGKKVIVMEPVKGGALVNLPDKAQEEIRKLGDGSQASYALRYAGSFPEVFMVLSGMGNMDMIKDNIKTFTDFVSVKEDDLKIYDNLRAIIRQLKLIPCTKCNYCKDVCPCGIAISDVFRIFNKYLGAEISRDENKKQLLEYKENVEKCIECGKCEGNCPQGIKIREIIGKVKKIVK